MEAAILDAGWDELAARGYERLTVGSVGARARTSEPVLYRRWANKHELVLAILTHYRDTHPIAVPDTGDLRDDLIEHLTASSDARAPFFAIAAAATFNGLSVATGLSPMQLYEGAMGEEAQSENRPVYQLAARRGELDLATVPPAILAMPYDLIRLDMLMNPVPVPAERIRSVVDELFLPLIQPYLTAARSK
ncbi:TetR/AcrR family transcriptional regulator [Microbacterium sp. STN6]|uniref:TetR/AcrR family transcriptional regulator n=1 Tax=Microbacterium sp. STN6 TaxID=2995588 RepID=UPI0022608461|nr:TetR/AcrR family transcriptional regulator [Microbacterium sp. STN6]MCX7523091.1 TetR/AcrR family transcriptional regulator [Microbacterium sp. STN6]